MKKTQNQESPICNFIAPAAPLLESICVEPGMVLLSLADQDGRLDLIQRWNIYRDGEKIASVTEPFYVDFQAPGATPSYRAVTIDVAGNVSSPSEFVGVLVK